jgi:hypothetical protein
MLTSWQIPKSDRTFTFWHTLILDLGKKVALLGDRFVFHHPKKVDRQK